MAENLESTYEELARTLKVLLKSNPTEANIRSMVNNLVACQKHPELIDSEKLIAEIIADLTLYASYEDPEIFEAVNTNHEPWFTRDLKNSVKWLYWNRYRKYLEESNLNPNAVTAMDEVTEDILSRMENPKREGTWTSHGMVVGYIQSGKTANYTGLICKAADAGYKLIIVLAGLHNDLRYQTQKRIDYGFIGSEKEAEIKKIVGVGRISQQAKPDDIPPEITCLTSSDHGGDFKKLQVKERISKDMTTCLVVKKNGSILKSLSKWLSDWTKGSRIPGKIADVPLLLIDDEADNASLNTSKYADAETQSKEEITSINRHIRMILNTFQKSAYVGYTATPYSNVFIDPDADSDEFGRDIFPSNYIVVMGKPPGYFGSDSAFGNLMNRAEGDDIFPGVVLIDDDEELYPEKEKKNSAYVPKHIPASLREAVLSFILSCIVRELRNTGVNKRLDNSMLIHASRFVAFQGNSDEFSPQKGLGRLIRDLIDEIKVRLGTNDKDMLSEFKKLWDTSYYPSSLKIREITADPLCFDITWEKVCDTLLKESREFLGRKLKIRVLTGETDDILDYSKPPDGLNVIVVGGDKLSRGLTLEGLTTSYFIRSANTYDTLLQMGRWFGFRSGYVDICRVYTTNTIIQKFKTINDADEHLRRQFHSMNERDRTPNNFGLKIIQNDTRFKITQQNKMRSGSKRETNPYSGRLIQAYKFQTDDETVNFNYNMINNFISELNTGYHVETGNSGNYIWRDIPVKLLLKHMTKFRNHPEQEDMGLPLYEYIESFQGGLYEELSRWTVMIVNKNKKETDDSLGGLGIKASIRTPPKEGFDESVGYTYGRNEKSINGSEDLVVDLNSEQLNEAYNREMAVYYDKVDKYNERYKEYLKRRDAGENVKEPPAPKEPKWGCPIESVIPWVRPATNGLLIIYPITWEGRDSSKHPIMGIAYHFPVSLTAKCDEVVVNKRSQEEEFWMDDI